MNRLFKKIASVAVGAAIALSAITVIGVEPKLQLYFSPHVMNDITGEITVDANIRNINVALAKHLGSICAVTFGNVKICAVEKSPKSEIYVISNLFF